MYRSVIGFPSDDTDTWIVRCPFCEHPHRHTSWPGEATAHCLEDQYVIYPADLAATDYDLRGYCITCRDDYLAGPDEHAANVLRLRPYAPANIEPSSHGLLATYVCNFNHWWRRTTSYSWPRDPFPGFTTNVAEPPYPQRPRSASASMRRCALYWHYDEAGVLLYVGITDGLAKRGNSHSRTAPWVEFAAHVKAVWLDSRADAERAEREAITTEKPVFNIKDADGGAMAQAARVEMYLRSRGALV